MKKLTTETADAIDQELQNIPEKYAKSNFNSIHEGYAVILEEVRELEQEVFFGEKKHKQILVWSMSVDPTTVGKQTVSNEEAAKAHRKAMREECIQIAAMCARFIQELC